MWWAGYIDFVKSQGQMVQFWRRATRSAPGSGEVWARYIRFLVSSTSLLFSAYLFFYSRQEQEQEARASEDEVNTDDNEDVGGESLR